MKKGFSLIELMVVITIIGVLSAIVLPKFSNITTDAKVAQVQASLANLRTSIGMFHAKNGYYPTFGEVIKNESEGDISKNGELSDRFIEFYSKSNMPATPSGEIKNGSSKGQILEETNEVVEVRNNNGGWLYEEEGGYIYANLIDGSYTGDPEKEVWNSGDDNGSGNKPDVPGGPGDWCDFIDKDSSKLEADGQISTNREWTSEGSKITPEDNNFGNSGNVNWDKFYLYDEDGNMISNPENDDGSYNYGDSVSIDTTKKYVVVLEDSENGEYLYSKVRDTGTHEGDDPGKKCS